MHEREQEQQQGRNLGNLGKRTMKGQESSMSSASGMHWLVSAVGGTCSLLLSPWTNDWSAGQTAGIKRRPSAQSPLTLTRQILHSRDQNLRILGLTW